MGKRPGPGLRKSARYPGKLQTAATASLRNESAEEVCKLPQPKEQVPTGVKALNPFAPSYLRATIEQGSHVTLEAQLNSRGATALVDSGATGIFMHPQFAQDCQAEIKAKAIPREVRVIDGRMINSGLITHEASVELQVGDHREWLTADITNTGRYPCVLGTPWLVRHDPTIRWPQREVSFDSSYCLQNCLKSNKDGRNRSEQEKNLVRSKQVDVIVAKAKKHAMVSPAAFKLSTKGAEIYMLEIFELSAKENIGELTEELIPIQYQDLREAFSEKASNELPEHGPSDMKIESKEGQEPRNTGLRPMSPVELEELRKYLEENLGKGWIRRSKSPVSAPIVFARKKDGSIRVCIDYRNLNRVTIRDRYPLPLIPELIDRLSGSNIFTKLDVRQAYHRVRMAPGHEFKTAFKTRYGLFEYLVMPFGLTNAPAQFQAHMQYIFSDLLDISVVIYLDDILIFSKNLEEHQQVVREVLRRLQQHGLYAKASKCEFHRSSVEFLGMIVSRKGLEMCPDKVQAIREWPTPKTIKEVQAFLGFANFYRRFICDYSKIAVPLTKLTRKNQPFQWNQLTQEAFEEIRSRFLKAPLLIYPNFEKPFIVETDASDTATGAILSQHGEDGHLHPCAYRSSKMSPAEQNYDIYDKELLSIVLAFQDWRVYLEGSPHQVRVISDHKNLEHFLTTKQLNRRQARWSEILSAYDFVIQHRPGSLNGRADVLSRRIDVKENGEGISKPLLRLAMLETCEPIWNDAQIIQKIKSATKEDMTLLPILNFFMNNPKDAPANIRRQFQQYDFQEGILYFRNTIYVPDEEELRRQILRSRHDAPMTAHPGRAKTVDLVTRTFYWPSLRRYVHRYVDGCDICQRHKPSRHRRYGLLQPIPAAEAPWKQVTTDFIVKLPNSAGFDTILVVVDKNTKLAHFIPTTETIDSNGTAMLYLHHVWKHHGTPEKIISDRGPVFVSKFMRRLYELLRIHPAPTTAFHPQSDGQTERVNQVLEQMLRMFTTRRQDDWSDLLPIAEFAYNNSLHAATGFSPFYATYGYHPTLSFKSPTNSIVPAAEERIRHLHDVHEEVKNMIKIAGEQAKQNYDRHVQEQPGFKVGDNVLLRHDNIATTQESRKLAPKFLGPYPIIAKISDLVYKLKLPKTLRIHDIFHVSLLEKYRQDTIPGRKYKQPPPIITPEGDIEWEVNKILDSRISGRGKKLQYLVS